MPASKSNAKPAAKKAAPAAPAPLASKPAPQAPKNAGAKASSKPGSPAVNAPRAAAKPAPALALAIPKKEKTKAVAPNPSSSSAKNASKTLKVPAERRAPTPAAKLSKAALADKPAAKTAKPHASSSKGSIKKAPAMAPAKPDSSAKLAGAAPKSVNASKPKHGGRRPGAGRPKDSGLLGDTICMRIPRSISGRIMAARDALSKGEAWPDSAAELHLYEQGVSAGFPTPSDEADGQSKSVDLYTLFSPKPESTFLVRVSGWSMRDAGIHDGDYLVVDRSIEPRAGHVVVAYVEGQGLLAKRLRIDKDGMFLDSSNPDFAPLEVGDGSGIKIWGVARAKAGNLL